jgi:hypothetical protein
MEGLRSDLPLLLKAVNNILVAPANFMREALKLDEKQQLWNDCQLTFTVQYFRPGFNRRTRKASGTTIRFFLSYGEGTPSKSFRRSRAAVPRELLWGTMPLMARYRILEGAR